MKLESTTILHIIYIPFRGVGVTDRWRDDGWFLNRCNTFFATTMRSLKAQTNKKFILWFSFRPEDYASLNVRVLQDSLLMAGLHFIFTFDGLMYYDDKFGLNPKQLILNTGRVIRNSIRHKQMRMMAPALLELLHGKNRTLLSRIKKSLPIVEMAIGAVSAEWVYLTRLDSDDMLRSDFVEAVQAQEPKIGKALTLYSGYIYNRETKQLAYYEPKTNPPFHTIIFPAKTFFTPSAYLAYYARFKSHEDIPKVFRCEKLMDRLYCVTVQNPKNHISTIWNHPFRKETIENPQEILSKFGLFR